MSLYVLFDAEADAEAFSAACHALLMALLDTPEHAAYRAGTTAWAPARLRADAPVWAVRHPAAMHAAQMVFEGTPGSVLIAAALDEAYPDGLVTATAEPDWWPEPEEDAA